MSTYGTSGRRPFPFLHWAWIPVLSSVAMVPACGQDHHGEHVDAVLFLVWAGCLLSVPLMMVQTTRQGRLGGIAQVLFTLVALAWCAHRLLASIHFN